MPGPFCFLALLHADRAVLTCSTFLFSFDPALPAKVVAGIKINILQQVVWSSIVYIGNLSNFTFINYFARL